MTSQSPGRLGHRGASFLVQKVKSYVPHPGVPGTMYYLPVNHPDLIWYIFFKKERWSYLAKHWLQYAKCHRLQASGAPPSDPISTGTAAQCLIVYQVGFMQCLWSRLDPRRWWVEEHLYHVFRTTWVSHYAIWFSHQSLHIPGIHEPGPGTYDELNYYSVYWWQMHLFLLSPRACLPRPLGFAASQPLICEWWKM